MDENSQNELYSRLQTLKTEQNQITNNFSAAHARLAELFVQQQHNHEAILAIEHQLHGANVTLGFDSDSLEDEVVSANKTISFEPGLTLEEKMKHARSLSLSEEDALALILQKIENEVDFQFQIWLLRQYITQPISLIHILKMDSSHDHYGLKIEIKRLVVKHAVVTAEVLEEALSAQEFDIRNDAINIIKSKIEFAHLLDEPEEIDKKNVTQETLDLASLGLLITQLSSNIIPTDKTPEELIELIDTFEIAVSQTGDEDLIEEMDELIELAKIHISAL